MDINGIDVEVGFYYYIESVSVVNSTPIYCMINFIVDDRAKGNVIPMQHEHVASSLTITGASNILGALQWASSGTYLPKPPSGDI